MTMSSIWKQAREIAGKKLNGAPATNDFLAAISGDLGKQLDAFEAKHKLADMQATGRRARTTIDAYKNRIKEFNKSLDPRIGAAYVFTNDLLKKFSDMISERTLKLEKATSSASMHFGSMRTHWQVTKKKIEADVKASGNRDDIAGMKAMLSEFDGGLGKELDTFERVFPDVLRMKHSKVRLLAIVESYRRSITAVEKKPGMDAAVERLSASKQRDLLVKLTSFEKHVDDVIKKVEHAANEAWLRQVPA
jgi:hypothetical protein